MKSIKLLTRVSFLLDFIAMLMLGIMFFGDYIYTGILHDISNPVQSFIETPGPTVEIFIPFIFILNFVLSLYATILAFKQKQLKTRSIFALVISLLFFIPAIFYITIWSSWSG